MNSRFPTSKALLLFLLLLIGGAPLAQAQTRADVPSADQLVRRLEQKYHSGTALRAQFTQITGPDSSRRTTVSGTLTLEGDRYRVETDAQTLVTDGETTWIYTPARRQVLVNDYVKGGSTFSPNRFFDGYRERYRATGVQTVRRDGANYYKLTLKPKGESAFFQHVTLWMRAADAVVTRLKVTDPNQSSMTFTLRDVTFGVPTDTGTFHFDPPDGVEVVDLRSS